MSEGVDMKCVSAIWLVERKKAKTDPGVGIGPWNATPGCSATRRRVGRKVVLSRLGWLTNQPCSDLTPTRLSHYPKIVGPARERRASISARTRYAVEHAIGRVSEHSGACFDECTDFEGIGHRIGRNKG